MTDRTGAVYQNSDQYIEAALKACGSEAIGTPGAIQSHGALIAVTNDGLRIRYASKNTGTFLRVDAEKLLEKSMCDVFGRKACRDLTTGLKHLEATGKAIDLGVIEFGGTALAVTVSPAQACTIVEFEPAPEDLGHTAISLSDLELLVEQAGASAHAGDLFEKSVQLLRMLTGYDRVSVLAFDENGHGDILAEVLSTGVESLLGLRFPSWDIPPQARQLMAKLPLRYIADSSAFQVPVIAAHIQIDDLDMSEAYLRAVSPVHLKYLRNMGISASLSLYILVEGRVWGMISFHHETPRHPSQRIRQICRSYAEIFGLKLSGFLKASDLDLLHKTDAVRRKLPTNGDKPGLTKMVDAELLKELATAMSCDGAALIYNNTISTVGTTPDHKTLKMIVEVAGCPLAVTASVNASIDFPQLRGHLGPDTAGLLIVQVRENCAFLFFRKAHDRVVRWAGAPEKPVHEEDGRMRLDPRKSFDEFPEVVKGTSDPWTQDQARVAQELRTIFKGNGQADIIPKTIQQQTLLTNDLNQRIKAFLALTRSLSHKSRWRKDPLEVPVTVVASQQPATAGICLFLQDSHVVSPDTTRVLEEIGFGKVDTARTVEDALEKIERHVPDLAILDIDLPHRQSSEPVARLLKTRDIPFIFAASSGDTTCLDPVFRDAPVLRKPVCQDALRRMVLEIMA